MNRDTFDALMYGIHYLSMFYEHMDDRKKDNKSVNNKKEYYGFNADLNKRVVAVYEKDEVEVQEC